MPKCDKCKRPGTTRPEAADGACLCAIHAKSRARDPCIVCLGEFHRGITLACGHAFHKKCLRTWAQSSSKSLICPMCRAPMTPADLAILKPKIVDEATERKRAERQAPMGYVETATGEIVEIRSPAELNARVMEAYARHLARRTTFFLIGPGSAHAGGMHQAVEE